MDWEEKMNRARKSFKKDTSIFLIVAVVLAVAFVVSCAQLPSELPPVQITEYITLTPTAIPNMSTATPTIEPVLTLTPTPRSGPNVVGVYVSGSGGKVLLSEYSSDWKRGSDIAIFNTFASNEKVLNYAGYRQMLSDCWFSFPEAKEYKIGYCLRYSLYSGEEFTVTIKKPSDIDHTEYLEVYLYDSVQQYKKGERYTHLSDKDMDDETMLYSFKLTPGIQISEVENITLEAFVYKYNDITDFDEATGEYIGMVSYKINIIKAD